VLSTYRRLIALRRSSQALRSGRLRLVQTGTPDVLAWQREAATERMLVVVNFANAERTSDVASHGRYRSVGGSHLNPTESGGDGLLHLRPLEAVVLRAD
jgi:glycosidase